VGNIRMASAQSSVRLDLHRYCLRRRGLRTDHPLQCLSGVPWHGKHCVLSMSFICQLEEGEEEYRVALTGYDFF